MPWSHDKGTPNTKQKVKGRPPHPGIDLSDVESETVDLSGRASCPEDGDHLNVAAAKGIKLGHLKRKGVPFFEVESLIEHGGHGRVLCRRFE